MEYWLIQVFLWTLDWAKVWSVGIHKGRGQGVLFCFRKPHVKGCVSDQKNKIL